LPVGTSLLASSPVEIVAYVSGSRVTSNFSASVPLYISYPDADSNGIVDGTAFSEASLYMVVLDTQTSTWQAVSGSEVVHASRHVLAPLRHFSVYALLGNSPASDLSDAKIYPNPWKPSSGGSHDRATLRIGGLPTQTEAYVYNVAGELVIHLERTNSTYYDWDGKNGSGEKVASGVYFLRLKTPDNTKIMKFAIQR
ncbi:MAG TPA: T9SS type A sorting domain-containing protein, partial [Elusimicrobiales bacterium]|nr:T9SS type A sorting domain-containing protein [Elusimicrobiales bacterium]